MFGTGVIRKATKVVVYTAVPIAGPLKAATVGTRASKVRSKKGLAEMEKQTKLLEELARKGR